MFLPDGLHWWWAGVWGCGWMCHPSSSQLLWQQHLCEHTGFLWLHLPGWLPSDAWAGLHWCGWMHRAGTQWLPCPSHLCQHGGQLLVRVSQGLWRGWLALCMLPRLLWARAGLLAPGPGWSTGVWGPLQCAQDPGWVLAQCGVWCWILLWLRSIRLVPVHRPWWCEDGWDLCAGPAMQHSCTHVAQWLSSFEQRGHREPHSLCALEWPLLSVVHTDPGEGLHRWLLCLQPDCAPRMQSGLLHRWD